MTVLELTRFAVAPERVDELLAARATMLADFQADRTGFIRAQLGSMPDGEWLDVVEWQTREDYAASRAKGANLPGIAAFFGAIDHLVSAECGEVV